MREHPNGNVVSILKHGVMEVSFTSSPVDRVACSDTTQNRMISYRCMEKSKEDLVIENTPRKKQQEVLAAAKKTEKATRPQQ